MSSGGFAVILFHSTSHAVHAEKVLKRIGIPCDMVPVPRHLSSDCGVCIRVGRGSVTRAREALEAARVEIEGAHDI